NICLATGLPIEIILKEFETFESVGLIYRLDDSHSAFFILNENFDFDSNSLFKGAEELDLKLKEISLQKKK
ncbi:MAG: hypothetical protein HKO66_01425, partial [Saprospiraceae bacterium]|nr:hypothetical protein [Saprospiraceae bacterium]